MAEDIQEKPCPEDNQQVENERDLRFFEFDTLELRANEGDGTGRILAGHGAVYDKLSDDLGGFRELFRPGSLSDTIRRDDIRSLFNHNPSFILGRKRAKTLMLEEDASGVFYEVTLPDTSYARDLEVSVERRDITGCSIMFRVVNPGKDELWYVDSKEVDRVDAFMAMWDGRKHKIERHVLKARLAEIGPVTFPAYPQTNVKARSLMVATGIDYDSLSAALIKSQRGEDLNDDEINLLSNAGDKLRSYIPISAEAKPGGGQAPDIREVARRLERLKLGLQYGYLR